MYSDNFSQRGREFYLVYKILRQIIHPNSYKMFEQCDRFTTCFCTPILKLLNKNAQTKVFAFIRCDNDSLSTPMLKPLNRNAQTKVFAFIEYNDNKNISD